MGRTPPPVTIDHAARRAYKGTEPLQLSPVQFNLLKIFLDHPGELLTQAQLATLLYGTDNDARVKTLHVHIYRLRIKLGDPADDSRYITTVRCVGHRWDGPHPGEPLDRRESRRQLAAELRVFADPYPEDVFPPDSVGGAARHAFLKAAQYIENGAGHG